MDKCKDPRLAWARLEAGAPLGRNLSDPSNKHNAGGESRKVAGRCGSSSWMATTGGGANAPLYRRTSQPKENDSMPSFDDRRDAFEKQFAHDADLRFKATARRNKLFGLWVAERLGKTGPDAEAYAKSVVLADFEEAGDADVIRKVRTDFEAAGKALGDAEIAQILTDLMEQAIEQVKAGR
jgi:hypothetical protein